MADSIQSKSFFRSGRYLLFWFGSLLSNIGAWMQQIAEPWVVLNLTNSPFWLGLDSFALNAPGLLFTLLGGVLADHYNRKVIILFFQAIQFLCVITMVILLLVGWLKVWMIVVISFLVGLTDSLSMPSFQSITPSLVEKKDIPKAVSLNSTQFNLSRILGPAIAGIVIVRFGALVCFSANAASYIPFFLSIYFIFPRGKLKKQGESINTKPVHQLKEFRKILINPEIRISLLTILITSTFCAPIITFCAVLIKNTFHAQAEYFGISVAAFGIGGLIGAAITFIPLPKLIKRNRLASILAIFLGLIIVAISLNHSFYFLIILLVFAGITLTASNISLNTSLQENVEENIRGRIVSLYQLSLSGGIAIGALITGYTVTQFNISTALLINGIMALILQIWLLRTQFNVQIKLHSKKTLNH